MKLPCNVSRQAKVSSLKKSTSFSDTRTYAYARTHNLDFSADYGECPSLFMFEFDSYLVLLCFSVITLSVSVILLIKVLITSSNYYYFSLVTSNFDSWLVIYHIWPTKNTILSQITDEILTYKLPKKSFPKCYW